MCATRGDVTSWVEISVRSLVANLRVLTREAGTGTTVMAVVKADAYGHGATRCSLALVRAGVRWLGVTSAAEGAKVRRAIEEAGFLRVGRGAPQVMAMCGFLAEDVATLEQYVLTPVVWTLEQVEWLRGWEGPAVHVEVDTGMGRQGVRPGADFDALLDALAAAAVVVDGMLTHFCCAEETDSARTQAQEQLFEVAIEQVRARGVGLRWVHAGNTSTVDNPAQDWPWLVELAGTVGAAAMVRCGLGLYGYCLPGTRAGRESGVNERVRAELEPVMTWKTRVLAVRDLVAGDTVGYGAAFVAPGPMRVALLAVGYADGLRRELSSTNERGGGWVIVRGVRAAVVGRVSMNLTVVDVGNIEGVDAGDEVVVLGPGVTAEDHARMAGTIAYEILCGVRAG